MALIIKMKQYRVTLTVALDEARDVGGLKQLFAFLDAAPRDSPLRWASVEPDHERGTFSRYAVAVKPGRRPEYTLSFFVPGDRSTDEFVTELVELFQKNGWEPA